MTDEAQPDGLRPTEPPVAADEAYELRLAHAEIKRLEAAVEARDAEIERLDAADRRATSEALSHARKEIADLRTQQLRQSAPVPGLSQGATSNRAEPAVPAVRPQRTTPAADAANRRRIRELEQVVSALLVGLEATKADIDRAAASKAWRYGHLAMRSLRRLTFRRDVTDGALTRARTSIEQTQEGHRQLPAVRGVARRRQLERTAASLSIALGNARRDVQRAADSRAWRYGHGVTLLVRRLTFRKTRTQGALVRAVDRIDQVEKATRLLPAGPAPVPERGPPPPPASITALPFASSSAPDSDTRSNIAQTGSDLRARLGPPPEGFCPPVSVVIVMVTGHGSPDGDAVVSRVRASTDYPDFDVVVGTGADYAAAALAGAARGSHDVLAFLDPAAQPLEGGWLRELTAVLPGAVMVAPTLAEIDASGVLARRGRLTLVREETGSVRVVAAAASEPLLGEHLGTDYEVPAVSSDCLLVSRAMFDGHGGFSPGYGGPGAAIDLALAQMVDGGRIVVAGRSVVAGGPIPATVTADERLLQERWGPRLRREFDLAMLEGRGSWADGRRAELLLAGLTSGKDRRMAKTALRAAGFGVASVAGITGIGDLEGARPDFLVIPADLDDAGLDSELRGVGAACLLLWAGPHGQIPLTTTLRERAHGVLVGHAADIDGVRRTAGPNLPVVALPAVDKNDATHAASVRQALRVVRRPERVGIKIGAPDLDSARLGGDLYFAEALVRAFGLRGHAARVDARDRWDADAGLADDIVVHLRGRAPHFPKAGQFNVLWCISHPQDLSVEECDGYDLVCVASRRFATTLATRTSTPVAVLEQATDPAVFHRQESPHLARDLAYVANSRGELRPIVRDLFPTAREIGVWGGGWHGLVERRHLVAEHIPNERLREVYSSATIVLADHWADMREHGFVSNRIYDALACGAIVISDDVAGLRDRFPGAVRVYSSAADLERQIRAVLALSPEARRLETASAVTLVTRHETFEHRVDRLLELISLHRSDALELAEEAGTGSVGSRS